MSERPPSSDARPTVLIVEMAIGVYGGIERVMLNVLPLVNKKWRVIYCDLWANKEYAKLLRDKGVEVLHLMPESRRKYVGGKGTLLRPFLVAMKLPWLLMTLLRLRRWIGRNRPDVLYFNRWEMIRAVWPALPRDTPCIFQSHGYRSAADFPPRIVRKINRRFARVVAVSRNAMSMLAEAGIDPSKLVCVYNGIDAGAVRGAAAQDGPPLPDRSVDDVIFVHPAVISPDKAQDVAIEALAKVRDTRARLWICGGVQTSAFAEYEESLKRLVAALSLGNRVSFLGWREDVARVMAASDVILLPSKFESFGMVLVEGMALGKPCVGAARGGIPEVISDGETGLIREPTPEGFAEAMNVLASSPDLRRRMSERSTTRVENIFGLNRQADALVAVLGETEPRGRRGLV